MGALSLEVFRRAGCLFAMGAIVEIIKLGTETLRAHPAWSSISLLCVFYRQNAKNNAAAWWGLSQLLLCSTNKHWRVSSSTEKRQMKRTEEGERHSHPSSPYAAELGTRACPGPITRDSPQSWLAWPLQQPNVGSYAGLTDPL